MRADVDVKRRVGRSDPCPGKGTGSQRALLQLANDRGHHPPRRDAVFRSRIPGRYTLTWPALPVADFNFYDSIAKWKWPIVSLISRGKFYGSKSTVLFASIGNLAGRTNYFEYAYSPDYSQRRPVTSATPRVVYFGLTLTR